MRVVIVGGGAAGFFTAINIAEKKPSYEVIILEKSNNLLSKVKVSGGGRCNVTNARTKPSELVTFYPRGGKKLHNIFKTFSTSDMVSWLDNRGVSTKSESDLRMFPITDSSLTVIDCFLKEAKKHGVKVLTGMGMTSLSQQRENWKIETNKESIIADKVIISTGSSNAVWNQLKSLGIACTNPVPSLFTFNISDTRIQNLQGISFENALIKIAGTKLEGTGPLLITHWGLSGPAILKLSAWGAHELNQLNYKFKILVNYLGGLKPDSAMENLVAYKNQNKKRKILNYPLFDLPKRFWHTICSFCGVDNEQTFGELSKKQINKLIEELTQGIYQVEGKSTFKEEFVTAGGVKLSEIDLKTFECKKLKNLYLAGEVLDIDALTGGFNFQACWSAGWIISETI